MLRRFFELGKCSLKFFDSVWRGKTAQRMGRKWRFFLVWELTVYSAVFLDICFDCSKKIFSSVEGKNTYRQDPESVWFFWLLTRICCIDCGVFRPEDKVFDSAQEERHVRAGAWKSFFPDCEKKAKDCNVFETFLIEVDRFLAVRSERDKNRWA